jgi:hypothetical protein
MTLDAPENACPSDSYLSLETKNRDITFYRKMLKATSK